MEAARGRKFAIPLTFLHFLTCVGGRGRASAFEPKWEGMLETNKSHQKPERVHLDGILH